ncbi:hsp90 co-chaperone Cdc37-like [Cimex lectularius]|uniref:Hsp90 co-chaperone Cdc37 n=1 Tax=Cimex lectularius TaxID=79782 RepID=A0A8I6RTJ0_CIMLE|nr:hsp90 co-chaperone Cdc37-like [Cimex lectularius]
MVDYSKWKSIEISDDEDETHPNIDTPSLFRWKHQWRVQRMEEARKEKDDLKKAKESNEKKMAEIKVKLAEGDSSGPDVSMLRATLKELEELEEKLNRREEELKTKERLTPWNVDTISQPGFTKTLISKPLPEEVMSMLSEIEISKRMQDFIKQNEKQVKEFGSLQRYDESQKFLKENPHLVCEDTANYLVIWCINLELEDKQTTSQLVAHQCICMQYIIGLAKQLCVDPRACVDSFYTKIQTCDEEYKARFEKEQRDFVEKIRQRAAEKLVEAYKKHIPGDQKDRLGPGGLDPIEVFVSLPPKMKECFEKQDVTLLQKTVAGMSREEVVYHMKRCIDSGLWVPNEDKNQTQVATVLNNSDKN